MEEAEAAAQGYVAGTMEADGFAYDGAAVYDADTNVCLRVYGDYPDEKAQAQAAIYAVEHDREAELPAFLDTYLIEAILLDDGGRKHTRQEIFAYFQTNRDIATRTKFLKSSYNDIWVEVLAGADKVRVGYHAEKDGLLMWEGSYLSRTAESVFSWGVVTEMTESLIERGEYKIKLGLQNATVMAEQMSFFGTEDSAAVYEVPEEQRVGELFPARQVPQEVIDQALYTAGNSYGSAERIAVFYTRQWPEADCAAFLRREFGAENGRGIEYEGKKYAVWFMEDGIHLAQGDSVRTGHCRTTVTWEQASARILELLEAGTYLSAPEMEQAQDKVLLEMGDALLMTARDLTEEGRAQGLFPQTLAIHDQRKGYPELDEDMVAFAKSEGGLAALAEEYHAFLNAYEQDRSIMRFRLSEYILTEEVIVETRYRTETDTWTDADGNTHTETYRVPYDYYICNVKLENFNLSHVPVYIMSQEQLSMYATYMSVLGNREDLFGDSPYVDKYITNPPADYDVNPEYLNDEKFATLITEAEKYLGYPYVWGGSNPDTSFDCSGFVSYVLTNSGLVNTGRLGAQGLYNVCTPVSKANAQPGDLIFFVGTYDTPGVSHVGIYVGDGVMIHCGDPIQYTSINSSYWQSHFYAFGRPAY